MRFIYLVVLLLVNVHSLRAEETPLSDPLQVELVQEDQTVQPGHPFWVALHFQATPNWHFYWKNPGDAGMATQIEWNLPPGFTAATTEWPTPHRFELNSMTGFGYEGDVWLLTLITPPDNLDAKAPVDISAKLQWVVCDDATCVLGNKDVKVAIPVALETPKANEKLKDDFAKARVLLPKKEWNAQAVEKEGVIQIEVQAPGEPSLVYEEADFFPAEPGSVDTKAKILLTSDTKGHYIVTLEGDNDTSKALDGILVLRKGQQSESIAVSVSDKDGPDPVAMGDLPPLEPPLPDYAAASSFEGGVGLAIFFAFLGGFFLNLMPCVLPVVSFKVLSFVKMAGQSRSLTLKHGFAFFMGVIVSFWILASLLLILQSYGQSVGWGFQLQEPLFVAFLAALLLVLGLSLFGVFELGTSVIALAGQQPTRSGLVGSFFSGVLATAVATPCSGPFLGSAVGFAVTLPPVLSLLIFTSLGVGMAFPYLVLAAYPQLLRFLPKPGAWMVTFKELMGFLMMATTIWLVWVFGAQTSSLGIAILLFSFLFLGIGCWIFGKWGTPVKSVMTRWISYAFVALCFSTAGYLMLTATGTDVAALNAPQTKGASGEIVWEEFSKEKIIALQKQGIPVIVDFTARWCLICQANHLVLASNDVSGKMDEMGVVRMKADWTKSDPNITAALKEFGRNSVPLYLLYGTDPSQPPVVLPQVLTPDVVMKHLDQIKSTDAVTAER